MTTPSSRSAHQGSLVHLILQGQTQIPPQEVEAYQFSGDELRGMHRILDRTDLKVYEKRRDRNPQQHSHSQCRQHPCEVQDSGKRHRNSKKYQPPRNVYARHVSMIVYPIMGSIASQMASLTSVTAVGVGNVCIHNKRIPLDLNVTTHRSTCSLLLRCECS